MVEGHEQGVDHDAQGDEQVDERVEYDERQILKDSWFTLIKFVLYLWYTISGLLQNNWISSVLNKKPFSTSWNNIKAKA